MKTETLTVSLLEEVALWLEGKDNKSKFAESLFTQSVYSFKPSQIPPLFDLPGEKKKLHLTLTVQVKSDLKFWSKKCGERVSSIVRGLLTDAYNNRTEG
jgi:hypothetical protein